MIIMAAFSNLPFLSALIGGLIWLVFIWAYGRLPAPEPAFSPLETESEDSQLAAINIALIEGLSTAIILCNEARKILYANPAALRLFPGIVRGQRFATLVRAAEVQAVIDAALHGERPEAIEHHIEDPIERHLRITASPLTHKAHDRETPLVVIALDDMTEAVRGLSTRGDFLANAAHELKTPVASLLGYIETLQGHAKDDAKARGKFLTIMQEQAERMQRLIGDILSLRQIEQTEHIAPTDTADLNSAVQSAFDALAPLAKQRGVTLVKAPYDGRLTVHGHQDELVQLVLNLVDNGVKMSPKGASISVDFKALPNWNHYTAQRLGAPPERSSRHILTPPSKTVPLIALSISDAGPGFAPEHLPRIGERFYRIAGDRSSSEKGTGLGLAIVKHIVMRHRGGLAVHSQREDPPGTTFTIFLPQA